MLFQNSSPSEEKGIKVNRSREHGTQTTRVRKRFALFSVLLKPSPLLGFGLKSLRDEVVGEAALRQCQSCR